MIQKPRRTELTAASTGSRKSKDKKTEASKEKYGNRRPVTSGTGVITAKMVSEYSSTRMATNTKVFGDKTRDMNKELTGGMRTVN